MCKIMVELSKTLEEKDLIVEKEEKQEERTL